MRLKYKKMILCLVMGIVGIGMVTFSFPDSASIVSESQNVQTRAVSEAELLAKKENQAAADTTIAPPSPSAKPKSDSMLKKDAYPDINSLIERYFAANLSCNEDDFKGLTKDASLLDMERMQRKVQYIKSYQNISCYTAKAMNEIDYVVYVTYDLELPVIETYAPSIGEFYIQYEDGTPYIYLGSLSSETSDYLSDLRNSAEVVSLIDEVSKNLAKALEIDENLKDFYEKLSAPSKSSTAEKSSAEEESIQVEGSE
ncbi:MAG: hypothetical protein E7256_17960 [Lachnospiraceae bacterium]|nr:hypothetical protein [Lachnospiraceae bacterium]